MNGISCNVWASLKTESALLLCRAMAEARKLIMKGCDLCPTSEDVWLEAARLQTPEHAKALLARGVSYNQTSVKLWIQVGTLRMLSASTADQACGNAPFC